ncbi:hypothetical protein J8TS2_37460 [Lederbergia ruris]|uniref:Uncharacterized protein n=1 Tax=Lederbergia ruris TaxID=217495 RepID=A0ABQ4KNA7_9BACI|nr:hypothetical protein [Lederbergia ruris]GIN59427.1 hypothetical protein J8TS2_37460 [Lederbergia ruris]
MNSRAINFAKNFSYTLLSNLVSLVISTLVVLIIPRLIGVEEYGYWQLYLFYSSYVGFLHFGWNDGVYLRFGGEHYNKLDKRLFHSQFYMLAMSQLLLFVILFILSTLIFKNENRTFVFQMTAICMLIVNIRYMLLFILQATNRIVEYSRITIFDRISYAILITCFIFINLVDYKLMIVFDLVGKLLSLIYAIYFCRDIVFHSFTTFYFSFSEAINNISVGIKLMFSNIASKLIIGVVRFGIERSWSISIFGKVSLTLTISGFMMLFINAIGIILFPLLRRSSEEKLPMLYLTMRDFLMLFLLVLLTVYYPFKEILSIWLPQYKDGLFYMAMLFPMILYEGKMALLINTYLKTLRKEKNMMRFNLIALFLSIVFTVFTSAIVKNLDLAVLSIVVVIGFRSIISEVYLSRLLKIKVIKDIVLELIMTILFIAIAWFIDSWNVVTIYAVGYLAYLIVKRKDLAISAKNLKGLISKE